MREYITVILSESQVKMLRGYNVSMIYFDYAAIAGPRPEPVYETIDKTLRYVWGSPGRGSHALALRADHLIHECRKEISRTFQTKEEHIAFTKNTTEALNLALFGSLNKEDHVLTTVMEHNSVLRPLRELERRNIITLDIIDADKNGFIESERIFKALKNNTALVAVNHVSNVNGAIQDIAEIGKVLQQRNTLFLVDAAQSAGLLPVNMQEAGIDLLAVPGHKHLMAPVGASFLCFSERVTPNPLLYGGTGSFSASVHQPEALPDRYQTGTIDLPALAGLTEALRWYKENKNAVLKEEKYLKELFLTEVMRIPHLSLIGYCGKPEKHTSVFSLIPKGAECHELGQALNDADLLTRTGLHCAPLAHKALGTEEDGSCRISFGTFTTEEEVHTLLHFLHRWKPA